MDDKMYLHLHSQAVTISNTLSNVQGFCSLASEISTGTGVYCRYKLISAKVIDIGKICLMIQNKEYET